MEFSQRDRLVWKINGYLILALAAGGVLLMCIGLAAIFFERPRAPSQADLVKVNEETKKEQALRLSDLSRVKGTNYLMASLSVEENVQSESNSSYFRPKSASYSYARNFVLIDLKTHQETWLFKDNSRFFRNHISVMSQIADEKTAVVAGFLFYLVPADTNKDGKQDDDDHFSLEYMDLASRKFTTFVDGVERLLEIEQTGDAEMFAIYARAGKTYLRTLDTKTLNVSPEREFTFP